MPTLLYIHGFLSSPASGKAVQVHDWLQRHRPDMEYRCPFLTPYFDESKQVLESIVEGILPEPVYLMGSSLGGYWATYLAERYDLSAVLINPLVEPERFGREFLGCELRNFHTNDTYVLEQSHVDALVSARVQTIHRPDNYWLLVQTGDETLDYRLAVEKYAACRTTVEDGGDHSFQEFERHIEDAIHFLGRRG